MLLNDYPQLIFTTQEGNCFMPTQAEKECRRITSIMNNHEKQQALTENREYHISNIHPHLFRHTFITLCYEFHMDPASIMLISGHNDIDMMKHYTHPDSVFINSELINIQIICINIYSVQMQQLIRIYKFGQKMVKLAYHKR